MQTPFKQSKYGLGKIARFISKHTVPVISKTKLTPNHITVLSFVFCIFAALAYSAGSYAFNILGAFLFFMFFVLDHVDGDLARYSGKTSLYGEALDSIVGKIGFCSIYFGICIGLAKEYDPGFIWFIAFILITAFLGQQILSFKEKILIIKNNVNISVKESSSATWREQIKKISFLRMLIREAADLYVVTCYLIIFGSLFNRLYLL